MQFDRSIWKGVLTDRGRQLPSALQGLTEARQSLVELARTCEMTVTELALWAALHLSGADHVLVGVSHAQELSVLERVLSLPEPRADQLRLLRQQRCRIAACWIHVAGPT